MTSNKYNLLLNVLRKPDNKVLAMYEYGSHVYGTNVDGSDEDFIVVLSHARETHELIERENKSFVIHDTTSLQRGIWAHEPYALETFFLPPKRRLKEVESLIKWDFKLDLRVLRESFSQKASHSWVKAKKKIEVEADYKRGKKSLFHSLRILTFGMQIAQYGKVVDYSAANEFWWDIYTNPSVKYEDYLKQFRPIYNGLCTKFRELAPKG